MVQLLARLFGRKEQVLSPVFELTDAQRAVLYSMELDSDGMVPLTGVLKHVFGLQCRKETIGYYLENCTGVRKALASDVHGHRLDRSDVAPFFEAVFARFARFEEQAQVLAERRARGFRINP